MSIKIAFIGAGSLTFTRGLFRDILTVPEFRNARFSFTDINRKYLDMTADLCRKDIADNHLPATVSATTNRRQAIEGADFVISCVRIGGLKAFKTDIEIPLKYGVDQCVGDTLCIGGIMYGQRNIASILEFCKDIREVAKPDCVFLNYANPNAMNTWAANHFGGIQTIGLCHGVMGGHHQITEVIRLLVNNGRKPGDRGYRPVTPDQVDIICAGINHQTWYTRIQYDGRDWTGRMLEGFERHPVYARTEKVRIDMLRRFGYYSTESNGHLSEYVAWYRKRPAEIRNWIDLSSWINGETGGYLRVCTEGRNWFEKTFRENLRAEPRPISPETRGHEHGSYIMEGLKTGRIYRGHFNVVNNGCITNLPDDAIVEVPGYVDHNGINIPRVGDLPLGCAAVCNVSIQVQRLAVQAAVHGDVALLKQAAMLDPLTGAVCDPNEISQMVDEMLIAQAEWLPQYRRALPAASARLSQARRNRTYRGTQKGKGAARITTATVHKRASDWLKAHGARIIPAFTASALQPPVRDLRKLACPVNLAFPTVIKTRPESGSVGFIDVRAIHNKQHGLVFLHTTVQSAKAGAGKLVLGPDGPFKAWVNGKAVACHPDATNPAVPGQYAKSVTWKRGANDVVVAVSSNRGNAWGLYAAAK